MIVLPYPNHYNKLKIKCQPLNTPLWRFFEIWDNSHHNTPHFFSKRGISVENKSINSLFHPQESIFVLILVKLIP